MMFYDAIVSGSIYGISGRHMFFFHLFSSGFGNDQENSSIIFLGILYIYILGISEYVF